MAKLFVTRPTIAFELLEANIPITKSENIYFPERPAWTVEIDDNVVEVIKRCYAEIGKALPPVILKYIAEKDGEANA